MIVNCCYVVYICQQQLSGPDIQPEHDKLCQKCLQSAKTKNSSGGSRSACSKSIFKCRKRAASPEDYDGDSESAPAKTKARGRIANNFHVSYFHVQIRLHDLIDALRLAFGSISRNRVYLSTIHLNRHRKIRFRHSSAVIQVAQGQMEPFL